MADINIQNILENIKARVGKKHFQPGRSVTHPTRDWIIILGTFATLNIIIIILSTFLFLQINKGEIFLVEAVSSSKVDSIDKVLLEETLSFFKEKERVFESLKRNKPVLVDPSL